MSRSESQFWPNRRTRKYVPNLAEQQAESARNFLLLMRLMPLLKDGVAVFDVPDQGSLVLTETERSRYTGFVTLAPLDANKWLQAPQFDIRVYYDAKLAEVASINGFRPISGRHNRAERDRQVDEKRQINQHLGEWLRHCLDAGLAHVKTSWR